MGGGSSGGGLLGGVGGIVGGLIGQSNASGYASQASNEAGIANQIMQNMAAVPDISQPLVLEQYRQAGMLTPAMEQQINLGVSQASQVKANPALQAAQQNALQQMAQRSTQGLTATDRAAFNQLQSQVGASTQGRMQAIQQQQQAQTGGQGTQGATLAAKLQASQQGANTEAMNADQLAAQAQQAAMQSTAQYGSTAGQMNQQQFTQQMQAAQSADAFRQFDVQNQVAQQARNVQAQNQASQYNLNLAQNIGNANVSQANQAQYNQLQREAQQWGMQYQQAVGQSNAAAGYGNTLSGMASQTAQAGANLGAGIGGLASQGVSALSAAAPAAALAAYSGGEIPRKGYDAGGQVSPSSFMSQLSPIQIAGFQAAMQGAGGGSPSQVPQIQQLQNSNYGSYNPFSSLGSSSSPSSSSSSSSGSDPNAWLKNLLSGGSPSEQDAENAANSAAPLAAGAMGPVGPSTMAANDAAPLAAGTAGPVGPNSQPAQDTSDASQQAQSEEANYPAGGGPYSQDAGINPNDTNETISQGDSSYSGQYKGGRIQKYNMGGRVRYDQGGQIPDDDMGIQIAGSAMPQAIASDTGAPPPRQQPQANTFQGPQQQSSGGAGGLGSLAGLAALALNKGGESDYRVGGKVPGKAQKAGDHPANDTVKALLSPGEIVLPRSIATKLKGAPDKDFNERLNKIVGPFIKKSQAKKMADGGEAEDEFDPPQPKAYTENYQANLRAHNDSLAQPAAPRMGEVGLDERYRQDKNTYYDGGQTTDNDSAWDRLKKTLSNEFNPTPSPTPAPEANDREADYEKIRAQNRANFGYAKGGKVSKKDALAVMKSFNQSYDQGGEAQQDDDQQMRYVDVDPKQSAEEKRIQDILVKRRKKEEEERNPFNQPESAANGPAYSKGGKIQRFDDGGQSQPQQPPQQPDSDDQDDDADIESALAHSGNIIRANPDSDKELAEVAQQEFAQPDQQDVQESQETEQKQPASLSDVSEEQPETADQSQAKTDEAVASALGLDEKPEVTKKTIDELGKDPLDITEDEMPVGSSEEKLTKYQQQLQRAQAERRALLEGAQGAKYGALIAAGLAGHGAKPASPEYFNNQALAQLPVSEIAERSQLEKEDPDSAVSQFYRQYLGDKMGVKVAQDVSASGLEKLFPAVTRVIGGEYQMNKAKTMADIQYQNRLKLQQQKQGWQQNQNDLSRQAQLQGHKMMADALGARVEPTVINTAVNQVEADPVLRPLRINQQATSLSLDMLEKQDLDGRPFHVNAQMLSDASNGFTQALALRPGAVTQKRYDQTSINTLKNNLSKFIGYYADQPDIDMRTVDPALYNQLHDYLQALNQDYSGRLDGERNRLYQEKIAAFKAAGRGNIVAGLQGAAGTAGPQGRPVNPQTDKVQQPKGNISSATLKDYAQKHKLAEPAAANLLKKAGYGVEGY